jgi:dihydrodipicolinate synthase/N-acetylneuraminate lyase
VTWRDRLREGVVIPAHPLALTAERKLDERRQRALTRYYLAAGAGGVAVGVHTTQFEIRDCGLLAPVLELAMEELRRAESIRIAGIVGNTAQALKEAEFAARLGYHAGLLSLGAMASASVPELLARSPR